MCKAIKVPCEPKTAFAKAMWIVKTVDRSLDSASCKAKIVSDCKTISALHRAKPRLSCEDKGKMPACFAEAISREAKTVTMPSPNSGAVILTPTLFFRANLLIARQTQHQYPRVRVKFPAAKLKLKHLAVLTTFARRQRAKHRSMLQALSLLFAAELRDRP